MAQPNRNTAGSPIEPGRVALASGQAARDFIRDATSRYFGPLQPFKPVAPPGTPVRQFDYPYGYNVNIEPRQTEAISFKQLRDLANAYDLLRSVIETSKNLIKTLPFEFRKKREAGMSKKEQQVASGKDARVTELQKFFEYPDREHDWPTWLGALLEDRYVIDAACVEPIKSKDGKMYALALVDGATITRKITPEGRTPSPPDVAYQQIIKGVPFVDLTADQLLYWPQNIRTSRFYGYSEVEQSIITVNTGLRRELFQLASYTEGNIPDGILLCPESWTAEQVKLGQELFNQYTKGDASTRSGGLVFAPGGPGAKLEFPKLQALKDEFDEWVARVICHVFGLPPNPFIKTFSRSGQQSSMEEAEAEGRRPVMQWVEARINLAIQKLWGYDDVEGVFGEDADENAKDQAQILDSATKNGRMTFNEAREIMGLEPSDDPEASMLGVVTASGFVPLSGSLDRASNPAPQATEPGSTARGAAQRPKPGNSSAGEKVSKKKLYPPSPVT